MSREVTCITCARPFLPERRGQAQCPAHAPARTAMDDARDDPTYRRNREIVLASGEPCHWCGAPASTADHLVPLEDGGSNALENLVPSCGPCNSSRGANRTGTAPPPSVSSRTTPAPHAGSLPQAVRLS